MSDTGHTEQIEFNSMVSILKRLDRITNYINFNRAQGNYVTMHGYLIDYYKEIVGDLTDKESEDAWNKLKDVKKYLNTGTEFPINPKAVLMLDEMDISLRMLAKKHGYLTRNMQSMRSKLIS